MLGIWKDFQELEDNLSMPELNAILKASRDKDYNERKFMAALQGVDLEDQTGDGESRDAAKAFEDVKARVFSRGQAKNSDDILSLQGINGQQAGFSIGKEIDYAVADENFVW